MIELVVFDLDGTLLDTLQDLAVATNAALKERGYPEHPVEAYRYFVGNGVGRLIDNAVGVPIPSQAERQALRAGFDRYYYSHLCVHTKPYPKIVELLEELQRRRIKLAVLTNKPHQAAVQLVQHYFPQISFAAVLGQREGCPLKPDPTVLLDLMKELGAEPCSVLYVGDSDVDMYTGSNAKVRTAGVTWGFRTKDELLNAGANVIIDKVDQFFPEIAR